MLGMTVPTNFMYDCSYKLYVKGWTNPKTWVAASSKLV